MKDSRTIRTERLLLREIRGGDTGFIVGIRSNPEAYRYFKYPHCLTVEEHEEWYRKTYLPNDSIMHWICEKDGIGIGVFAAVRVSDYEAEVSYLVSGRHRRKGYAGEALKSVVSWIRQKWRTGRILAKIHQDNAASRAFIRSLGFHEESREDKFLAYAKDFEGKAEP